MDGGEEGVVQGGTQSIRVRAELIDKQMGVFVVLYLIFVSNMKKVWKRVRIGEGSNQVFARDEATFLKLYRS